jgi:hypothetical protein
MSKRNRKINNQQKHQKGMRQEKQLTRHQQHEQAIKELHGMFTQHVNVLYNRLTSQGLVIEAVLDFLDEKSIISKQDMVIKVTKYTKNTNIYNALINFNADFADKNTFPTAKEVADKLLEHYKQNKMKTIDDFDDNRIKLKEIFPNQYEDAMTIFRNLVEDYYKKEMEKTSENIEDIVDRYEDENIDEIGDIYEEDTPKKYMKDTEEGTTDES